MSATEQNFSVRRGDDGPAVAFAVLAADGTPAPAPTAWMWKYAASETGPAIGTKSGTNFNTVFVNSIAYLAVAPPPLTPAETAAMVGGQTYYHELEVTTAAGKLDTPATGKIYVTAGMR